MTIKTRNRLNFFLFLVSLIILVINVVFFFHYYFRTPIKLNFSDGNFWYSLFFAYQPLAVYVSLFFMNLYVVITAKVINNAFAKTNCTEISFFFCFLLSCIAETVRFYIPMFSVETSFSDFLILLGNFSLFARILAPLSVLFAVIMTQVEERQNLERNMGLIIIVSLFIAMVLPLNTGIIEKDFRVHAGFDRIVVIIEILVDSAAVISLFFFNLRDGYSQKTTFGLAMIISGFVLSINSVNFFILILSLVFFTWGTFWYLKALHDRYLFS